MPHQQRCTLLIGCPLSCVGHRRLAARATSVVPCLGTAATQVLHPTCRHSVSLARPTMWIAGQDDGYAQTHKNNEVDDKAQKGRTRQVAAPMPNRIMHVGGRGAVLGAPAIRVVPAFAPPARVKSSHVGYHARRVRCGLRSHSDGVYHLIHLPLGRAWFPRRGPRRAVLCAAPPLPFPFWPLLWAPS